MCCHSGASEISEMLPRVLATVLGPSAIFWKVSANISVVYVDDTRGAVAYIPGNVGNTFACVTNTSGTSATFGELVKQCEIMANHR